MESNYIAARSTPARAGDALYSPDGYLVGESSLRRALQQYLLHYHEERNHQGKENRILFPFQTKARRKEGAVQCRERLGGLLKYYEREAA